MDYEVGMRGMLTEHHIQYEYLNSDYPQLVTLGMSAYSHTQ